MKREDFRSIRPWSEIEVAQAMAALMERMDDAVDLLTALGTEKDGTAAELAKHRAHYLLVAKVDHPELKSDAMREAWMIDQVEETAQLQLAADLADSLYKDQTMRCRMLMSQSEMLRSMLRSARDNIESWPENRAAAAQREREAH